MKQSDMCYLADIDEAKWHVQIADMDEAVTCTIWRTFMKQSDMCYLGDMEEAKCHVQIGGCDS